MKLLCDLARSMNQFRNYDYAVRARSDLSITLGNVNEWLVPGVYNMPSIGDKDRQDNSLKQFNDWFGVSDFNTLCKVWDYENIDTYCDIYQKAWGPEEVLKHNILRQGIRFDHIALSECYIIR
jgi:hypothetical protein